MCAPRIQRQRAEDLVALNTAHRAAGGHVYMVTLTVPHDQGDDLKPMRKHVSAAWSRCINGAPWKRWKERLGLVGTVRAMEVTHGPAGWHPHLHVALYTKAEVPNDLVKRLRSYLWCRWSLAVTKPTPSGQVWRMPHRTHGVVVSHLATDSKAGAVYLAKMGLAAELVSGHTKKGRGQNRTPFQVLRDASLGVDRQKRQSDALVWREYTSGIAGARQISYSRGLLALYGLAEPVPDESVPDNQASLELGPAASALDAEMGTICLADWFAICKHKDGLRWRLAILEVAGNPDLGRDAVWGLIVEITHLAHGRVFRTPPPRVAKWVPLDLFPSTLSEVALNVSP